MIINKINFPIYGSMIFASLIAGMLFNYLFLKRNKIEKRHIILFMLMLTFYAIFGGIVLNAFVTENFSIFNVGLSSYGGAIGIIISSLIFEKICPSKGIFIKGAVISLPLIYSISKLSCFFAGCCYGIPYSGKFSVIYTSGLNIPLFPIQLLETILFMIVFVACCLLRKNKHIVGITFILSGISKFSLDFFRYSHLQECISLNQIISILFIVIGIGLCVRRKNKI